MRVVCRRFAEDKRKSILFTGEKINKKDGNISYSSRRHDEDLPGQSMATKVIGKINCRIKFLYHKNKFLQLSTTYYTML